MSTSRMRNDKATSAADMRAAQTPPQPAAPAPAAETAPPAREVEIKFRADGPLLAAVLKSPLLQGVTVSPARELISTYFDTAEHHLRRSGMTLRLRRKGRAIPVLGVKWEREAAEDVFGRGEVEVRCPDGIPNLELFDPALREQLATALAGQPLMAVFETRMKRRVALLQHGHSDIELSLDQGAVIAGSSERPIAEVELELKGGNLPDLLACAGSLARASGLTLDFEPKAARGYRLVEGAKPKPQKAVSLAIPATATFDDLVTAVIANTLRHFMANWASLRESDAPESIHQLRVALRRMRSALGVFRRAVKLPELENIRAEARRIASALGPARECDAFRQNALAGPFRNRPEQLKGAVQLLEAVESGRQQSYAAARQLLDDPATSLFVLDVQDFLARRAWRTALAPADLGLLTSEARLYGAAVLERLRKRALKRGKTLPDMPDEERHELRIALKNLRYAAEFFGSLFGKRKEVRSFIQIVADLQEDLGAHNDAATAENFITSLDLPPDAAGHFASGYLLGWYRHATQIADSHLERKWKSFRHASVFWQ